MKQAKIYANDFNRIIDATKKFVRNGFSSANESHAYIRLEFSSECQTVTAVAVDGYRLSIEHSVISDCDEDFTVFVKANTRLPRGAYAVVSVEGKEVQIRCNVFVFGYEQPKDDFMNWKEAIPKDKPKFEIGFNGNYLLETLQAAKASCGSSFKSVVRLEFRDELSPVIVRTNEDDIKLLLPVRLRPNSSEV